MIGHELSTINPAGFKVVDQRRPKKGELVADCRGAVAWIWRCVDPSLVHEAKLVVTPTNEELSYP